MPRYTARQTEVRHLLNVYTQWKHAELVRKRERREALRRLLQALRPQPALRYRSPSASSSSSSSAGITSDSSDPATPGSPTLSDSDFSDWDTGSNLSDPSSTDSEDIRLHVYSDSTELEDSFDSTSEDDMDGDGSDSSSGSSSLDGMLLGDDFDSGDDLSDDPLDESGHEADDEDDGYEDPLDADPDFVCLMGQRVRDAIREAYAKRYQVPRNTLPRGPAYMPHVLYVLKNERPDHFRQQLRVWPHTFDRIVEMLQDDPVFSNDSNNPQMPVAEQIAITLYRFGTSGNGVCLQNVANWAGVGKGTVSLVTHRVISAAVKPAFMNTAVRFPTEEEKKKAKLWVGNHSCAAWEDGWLSADGTLVCLYSRPWFFGPSYFDRKSNYSLNVQVRTQVMFLAYSSLIAF